MNLRILLFLLAFLPATGGIVSGAVGHPDGIIGKPGGEIFGDYSSSSSARDFYVRDHQSGGVGITLPATPQVTIKGQYFLDHRDSLFHNIGFGVVFYPANPVASGKNCNPDGRIGYPVISADFGLRLPDPAPDESKWRAGGSIIMPLTSRFSLGLESKFYEEEDKRLVDKYAGLLNIYFRSYPTNEIYSNPDGAEGSIALNIKAGGSANGTFFQIDCLCPLDPELTVGLYIRGEKIKIHNIKTALVGFRLKYYPGQQ
jgi:hypothetical protein